MTAQIPQNVSQACPGAAGVYSPKIPGIGTQTLYSFGTFQLKIGERLLLENGRVIQLTPKAFDLLQLLLENAGRTLTKEELLRQLWPDTHVDQSNLSQHIFWIRKALGESGEDSQFIETVPKVGYRFVASVSKEEKGKAANALIQPPPDTRPSSGPRLGAGWVAAAVLVLIVAAVLPRWWPKPKPAASRSDKAKLAVLPFVNLNNNAAQDYLSDGFTEEMITLLGRMRPEQLGVIAVTTMMHYKNSHESVAQIGKELGVDYVLEGGVQRDGERVRINARLIQVKDQTEVWARSFDRDLVEVLALQSEVGADIAQQIEPKLAAAGSRRAATPMVNRAAYEDYLRGRYFWNKRTVEDFQTAIDYFRKAIQKDPKYARAYTGLADAYALLGSTPNSVVPRKYAMSQARAAALEALKLDDSLAEAHTSLAFVKMHYDWDWRGAEYEFQRAIALDPAYPTAHHWYAYYLAAVSRQQASLDEIKLAQQLDPLSVIINTDVGDLMFYAGQLDGAIQQAKKALEIDPRFSLAHFLLGRSYARKGQYEKSIEELQQADELSQHHPWAVCGLAAAYARAGNKTKAKQLLQRVRAQREDEIAYCVATTYAAMGDKDTAFSWLDTAYRQRSGSLILLQVDPTLGPLRTDRRFDHLAESMAFPPRATETSLSRAERPSQEQPRQPE